jgi:acyl-CoA synthetase (AMP-forming)/AMP-acid ligase II
MAPKTIKSLIDAFPDKQLFIMYGQTEAAPRVTWLPPDQLKDKLGSIGIPLNGVQVDILDPDGNSVPTGETGELVVRGPNVMLGYWNQPEEQELVLKNGALYTGDLGYKDDDGFLWIEGRSKEIIKSGGNRVSAKEIEDVLLSSEAVLEAVVVGMPDDLLGEAIIAVVAAKPDITLTEEELKKHCRVHLPMHKLPQRFVIMKSLPKQDTGKVNKLLLKEQL